jgi:tetratricopeptide (TPR) repeat protein
MRRLTGTVCFYVLVLCGFAGVAALMVRSAPRAEPRPVELYAEQAVPPLERGRRAFLKNDHARALFYLDEAIRLEPQSATAYSLRGLAHAARGESDAAKSDFDDAIRLNPEDVKAYLERARLLAGQKDYCAAAADYSKCIELDPVEPEHFTARARVYEMLREGKKAEADYTDAIRLAPTAKTYNDRAVHYLFRAMYREALADCDKAMEADSAYAMGHYHRACAYDGLGETDRAIASANEALRIEFRFHEALALRGRLYARKKEYQTALIDFSQAIQFAPSSADYYRWRGEVLEALGETSLAAQDFQLAAQLMR